MRHLPVANAVATIVDAVRLPLQMLRMLLLLPVLGAAAAVLARQGAGHAGPSSVATEPPRRSRGRTPDISVVVPFYNPGEALRPTVERLVSCLRESGTTFEVIAVSDGSTDGSERSIEGLADEVTVVVQPHNRGKGAALQRGLSMATGAYVSFVDADGDIDPAHLVDYLERAKRENQDVVYASKRHRASTSASSVARKVVSYGYIATVALLFGLGVQDTQTGCKLVRREVMDRVLPCMREQGFAFDLEFFVVARAQGVRRMQAAPVELAERLAGSTVGLGAVARTLRDTLAVLGRLHLTSSYLPQPDPQPMATVVPLGAHARPAAAATPRSVDLKAA